MGCGAMIHRRGNPGLSPLCLLVVRRTFSLYLTLGFALRGLFVSLALLFLAPRLRCTVAIGALQIVVRLESHGVPFLYCCRPICHASRKFASGSRYRVRRIGGHPPRPSLPVRARRHPRAPVVMINDGAR